MTFDEFVAQRLPERLRYAAVLSGDRHLAQDIVLRYYEGLDDAEIAELLGCRPATVRAYASRALATLRINADQGAALSSEDL
jgi:DNA-directed RNA polymerase specialized sigma24 family protein